MSIESYEEHYITPLTPKKALEAFNSSDYDKIVYTLKYWTKITRILYAGFKAPGRNFKFSDYPIKYENRTYKTYGTYRLKYWSRTNIIKKAKEISTYYKSNVVVTTDSLITPTVWFTWLEIK